MEGFSNAITPEILDQDALLSELDRQVSLVFSGLPDCNLSRDTVISALEESNFDVVDTIVHLCPFYSDSDDDSDQDSDDDYNTESSHTSGFET